MSEKRKTKEQAIRRKMIFIESLLTELRSDFEQGCRKQEEDYDKYNLNYTSINNHTRYANDVVRLRRELLKLWNMLMSS